MYFPGLHFFLTYGKIIKRATVFVVTVLHALIHFSSDPTRKTEKQDSAGPKLCPALCIFWATSIAHVKKASLEKKVLGLLPTPPTAAVGYNKKLLSAPCCINPCGGNGLQGQCTRGPVNGCADGARARSRGREHTKGARGLCSSIRLPGIHNGQVWARSCKKGGDFRGCSYARLPG